MNNEKNELLHLVHTNIQEMVTVIQDLEEETIRWNPAPEEWSMMQIVAHVSEAIPYWIDLTQRIIKDPNTKIDRGVFSESRLYAISEENTLSMSPEDAVDNLEKLPSLVEELLFSLTDEQFQEEAVQYILDIEIIKHIEEHIHQMERNLSKKKKHDAELKFHFLNR